MAGWKQGREAAIMRSTHTTNTTRHHSPPFFFFSGHFPWDFFSLFFTDAEHKKKKDTLNNYSKDAGWTDGRTDGLADLSDF